MTQITATYIDSTGSDRSVAYASKLEELKAAYAYAYAHAYDAYYDADAAYAYADAATEAAYAAYVDAELKLLQEN